MTEPNDEDRKRARMWLADAGVSATTYIRDPEGALVVEFAEVRAAERERIADWADAQGAAATMEEQRQWSFGRAHENAAMRLHELAEVWAKVAAAIREGK